MLGCDWFLGGGALTFLCNTAIVQWHGHSTVARPLLYGSPKGIDLRYLETCKEGVAIASLCLLLNVHP